MSSSLGTSNSRSTLRPRVAKGLVFLLAVAVLLTSLSNDAEARRRKRHRKKSRSKRAAVINEKKLFERIGGTKVLNDVVDEWLRLSLADGRVSALFAVTTAKPESLAKWRRNLNEQLCDLSDGPCQYKGPDWYLVADGKPMQEDQSLAFAEDLFKSLQKFNVPEREKNELLGRLGALRSEGVGATSEEEP